MERQKAINLLKEFKAAYDGMNAKALSQLFADGVNFKGTGDNEYDRNYSPEKVEKYFQDFVDARQNQKVELNEGSLEISQDGEISIDAAFHFVNKDETEEKQKPISFKIKTDEQGLITDFGSFPALDN